MPTPLRMLAEQNNPEEHARRFADVQQCILNALPATIALLNHEGTILSVNDPWRIFSSSNGGDEAHTGIGVNYFEACGEESPDVVAGIGEVIAGRSTFFEKEYPCHSPTQNRWFHLMVRPLPLPEGPGAVVMHVDITDRYLSAQAIARGERRYRSLVQANSSIVWSAEADGHVTREVPMWQEITGQTFDEYRGAGWASAIHPDDVDRVVTAWKNCVANRRPLEIEYRMRVADGGYRDFVVKGVPVIDADGSVREWVGTHCDITDRKRIEEFERERNHLRDALTAHDRVLGVVGHELRTPLAATRAMTECLLCGDRQVPSPQEEIVRSIHEQLVKMSSMLNDLLEIAGMNSGTVHWNWGTVDVSRACTEAIAEVRAGADCPRVVLNLSMDPQDIIIRGDAEAIRRLVLNLVSNACKFTEKGSVNVVVAVVKEDDRDWIQIEVIDTGVGMSESMATRVGEPFALSGGVTGNDHINGAGLGLPICRGIVAAHGGRIWLQSQVGVGTHITVRLRPDLTEPSTADYAAQFIRRRVPI